MKTLLAHEKKTAVPIIPGMQMPVSDESSTSDSEAENSKGPSAVAYPGKFTHTICSVVLIITLTGL